MSIRSEAASQWLDDLTNDLDLIGEIKPERVRLDTEDNYGNENESQYLDVLSFEDFCRLFQLIKRHTEPRVIEELKQIKALRRKALSELNMEEYRHLVQETLEKEEDVHNEVTETVFDYFNITKELF